MIVRLARVPHHESVFCRRVAGPGLTAPGYCGLSAGQAAAAAAARAELDALLAWQERTEREIERPLHDYRHFVDACFGPFSVQIAKVSRLRLLRFISKLGYSFEVHILARDDREEVLSLFKILLHDEDSYFDRIAVSQ